MASLNICHNLSNASSCQKSVTCDIFDNSFPVQIGQIFALSVMLFSSLVGNILIVITVYKRAELRKTINYFIVNMALSDFAYPLTDIPVELIQKATGSRHWPIGGTTGLISCRIKIYLEHVSVTVSVQSLVWIALDRFVAVVYPMKAHLISSRLRAFAIASTWIVAMVINSSDLYTYGLVQRNGEAICIYSNNAIFSFMNDGKVHIYVFHILPMVTLTILYFAIVVAVRRQDKALRCPAVHQKDRRKQQAVKMSLSVVAAFIICSLPMTLYNILDEYKIPVSCTFEKTFLFLSYLMFYLSSTINPIICFSFVGSYRRGLREIFTS